MAVESHQKLEQVANFFEDRIETVKGVNGSTVFIQRPKPKDEGAVASVSAADLPDDFSVNTITANSTQLYRIAFGPIDVAIKYDVAALSADINIKLNVPLLGSISVAQVHGNLKTGIQATVGYRGIAKGEVGVRLDGSSVVLYWDVKAYGTDLQDEIELFSL